MKNTAKKIYIALIFLFLYAPIATLMVLSFNASKTRAKWGGFTFKWYTRLIHIEHRGDLQCHYGGKGAGEYLRQYH